MDRTPVIGLMLMLAGCGNPQTAPVSAPAAQQPHSQPDAQGGALLGVDLSNYQGQLDDEDFKQIAAAGHTFVFIKATEGDTVSDADYGADILAARAAGLSAGSYHFYLTDDEPADQFTNFSKHASVEPGDLPPVVDIESLSKNSLPGLVTDLQQFLSLLQERYGARPIVYSGVSFANEYLKSLGDYPLWIAQYDVGKPQVPQGWSTWTFWQYSQDGVVAGVDGNVDLNRFNGGTAELDKLLIKGSSR